METMTYLIRKGTRVWVVRNLYPVPNCYGEYEMFSHVMRRDMTFIYPYPPGSQGPGVIALAKYADKLSARKRSDFREIQFVVPVTGPKPETHNILSMLEMGFDFFATKHRTFPFIAAAHAKVDALDGDQVVDDPWDIEDKGDGLKIYRKNTLEVDKDLEAYGQMMEMNAAESVVGPPT